MSDIWDGVAASWERNAQFVDAQLQDATQLLLDEAAVTSGDTVIELACGPGGAGLAAAERIGATGSVLLADVAPDMVAAAARRAAAHPNVTTAVFDQLAIDRPDASADAIISRLGLMFAPEPATAVREAARVLRPDGRYAAMTWGPRSQNAWLGLILDEVGRQFDIEFPPPEVPGPFSLQDAGGLAAAMGEGGLQDVRVTTMDAPMRVTSLDDWWERVTSLAGPLTVALAAMEPDVRQAIRERSLAAGRAAAQDDGDGLALTGTVLVASGRRDA
ncbi:class I SAM-dependent methyltransferase [Paraconexibacter sp.]|uniref:class I SAM-dependent methyltransferase n=1 Tax=Paraconexibacter sp. TaxID=2949640 RepID=UPI0035694607